MNVKKNSCQTPFGAVISGLFGILVFLLVLVIFRYVADHTSFSFFTGFVDLLFANAGLVIIFSLLFMIGEVFRTLDYPFNIPFPIFNAIGSVLLVSFIIRIILFVNDFYALGIEGAIAILNVILYPLVFLVVLLTGYASIYWRTGNGQPSGQAGHEGPVSDDARTSTPSWEEVGGEFRQMLRDIFRRIRDEINRK